ncbi:hypothetical protein CF64_11120 [Bradyrhizobium japonicum]|nr:hypothetical protein CF64_11120 [Bradyrhizobium japonicum]
MRVPDKSFIAIKGLSRNPVGIPFTPATMSRQKLPISTFAISSQGLAASPALPPRTRCNMMGWRRRFFFEVEVIR